MNSTSRNEQQAHKHHKKHEEAPAPAQVEEAVPETEPVVTPVEDSELTVLPDLQPVDEEPADSGVNPFDSDHSDEE